MSNILQAAVGAVSKAVKAIRDTLTRMTWEHNGLAKIEVKGYPALYFNPMKASLANRKYAEQFGWQNRFMNKTSVKADPVTGKTDLGLKYRLAKELIEFYEAGGDAWEMRASSGGEGANHGAVLMALMAVKGWDIDKANAKVSEMAEAKKVERKDILAALAKDPKIILEVAAQKAKAAAVSTIDADSLLDELDDDEDDVDDEEGEDTPE